MLDGALDAGYARSILGMHIRFWRFESEDRGGAFHRGWWQELVLELLIV